MTKPSPAQDASQLYPYGNDGCQKGLKCAYCVQDFMIFIRLLICTET